MNSVLDSSEEKTNGTRLLRLVIDGGTYVLREYLQRCVLPPVTLQDVLNNHRGRLGHLKSVKKKITDFQWNQLFPSTGDPPDPQTFDITLLHLLLREVCGLTVPVPNGWHEIPIDTDTSDEANIVRIKLLRNKLCHGKSTNIPNVEFQDKWQTIVKSLVALGLKQEEVDRLKTEPIDHDTERRINEEVEKWKMDFEPRVDKLENDYLTVKGEISAIQASISEQSISEHTNCLPDKNDIFGRSKEVEQILSAIQTKKAAAVLVTGGPGFGKTAVAIEVGHELASNLNEDRIVLFCPLRSKATIGEVATSMILTCSTSHSQPPAHPQHWLRNWSKQQQKKVFLILDNADDVLESDDQAAFVSILGDMRTLSNCKLTFVITTRKVFYDPNLPMEPVRLCPLSPDHAEELLLSKVCNSDVKLELNKTDELVQLCGCVPLALCIVGSLLSDYPEDQLIKRLEEKPLDVLRQDESDTNSVEKAIDTSFNFLDKNEQKALVLLSVFPGSFRNDAAQAVIQAGGCQGDPIFILRSLKNRSLIETPASCRYQIHQFIQTFAKKKIDQAKHFPFLQLQGEKVACIHFFSCLVDIANRYWSKDKCKEAIQLFNIDRHNFEYFFQFLQSLRNEDPQVMETVEKLMKKISQTCIFLEMCVLPGVYMGYLNELCQLLTSRKQSVTKLVELLCLLGLENRKIGNQNEYKKLIDKAADLHSKHSEEFDNEKVSEAFFCNNYAKFLSEMKRCSEAEKQFVKSLKLCEQHMDSVQKGISLLYAGRNDNCQNKRELAEEKFNKSLHLFQENLGNHIMTALLLKEIADFHLFHGEKGLGSAADQQKSLKLYEQALERMESVGIKDQKECILPLTNLGLCYQLQVTTSSDNRGLTVLTYIYVDNVVVYCYPKYNYSLLKGKLNKCPPWSSTYFPISTPPFQGNMGCGVVESGICKFPSFVQLQRISVPSCVNRDLKQTMTVMATSTWLNKRSHRDIF
ncbi:E3 ubiquitin-protein ligase DZIP3 [Stylophora pistillata]|uniref:E3 ubiquitin-protein ligase DZIP3 n=1 Tax=Stylophora pistillata TaxID=50429 RepID=A0A2B4SJX5_STYPI|nr:E3 ubiquitin-protein ligase DZIP3 [Stylophora pistillata]